MNYLLSIDFTDLRVTIVNTVIIFFLLVGIYTGYKRGFLETGVRFAGMIFALLGAFLFKNPISVILYTYLPFFKFGGIFKGVSVLNILIYELIAFILVFSVLMIVIKLICKITGLVDRILSFLFLLELPNRILGAVIGFLESFILLFFVCFGFKFGCKLFDFEVKESLADYVVKVPILNDIFGDTLDALSEISGIVKEYDGTNSKDEYNYMAMDILLKYDIITTSNASVLVESNKIKINNFDELIKEYGDMDDKDSK